MNKLWKALLAIGGIIGGILLLSNKNKSTYKKDLKDNINKTKEVNEKILKVEKDKKKTKAKIKNTDKKIFKTKSKSISTKSAKKTTSNFKKKYRK
tara:strand:+ start:368 stop:652 length:285 start_codon:yes stop_codon:yes gene_type:complete